MKKVILCFFVLCISLFLFIPSGYICGQTGATLTIKEVNYDDFPNVDIYFSAIGSSSLPIKDLTKDDIELKEDNEILVDYNLESLTSTTSPIYIALLLDNSGSMNGSPLEEAKEAAIDFINLLKGTDEVKIFVFNDKAECMQDFTTDKDLLVSAINDIEIEGSYTVLNKAVYDAAGDLEDKPVGNRAIVLLTDGKDDSATLTNDDAINKAKDNKIPIHSIGFGENFDKDSASYDREADQALNRFSILTSGNFFAAKEEKDLKSNFTKISDILKEQYHISYESNLPKDGAKYVISISIEGEKDSADITTPTFEVTADLNEFEDSFKKVEEKIDITPNIKILPDKYKAEEEIVKVEYYLDTDTEAAKIGEVTDYPFTISFDPENIDYGDHTLILKIYDSIGGENKVEKPITIPAPEFKILLYSIIGGSLLLIIIIVVMVILLKRRKKKIVESFKGVDMKGAGEFVFEDKGGSPMTEGETGETWAGEGEGEGTLFEEGGKKKEIGTETVIVSPKESVPMAWLTVVKGSKEGKEYEIPPKSSPKKRRVTIGRSTYNDIVIDDETVSKDHAFIIIEKNNYRIGDSGSANGTFVNDKKISSPKILKDGDKVNIGDSELVFKNITFKKKEETKTIRKKSKKLKKSS